MPDWTAFAKEAAVKIWKLNRRIDLITEIQSELRTAGFDLGSFEVSQNFDRIKRIISRQLAHKIDEMRTKGMTPRFKFSSTYRDILIPLHDETIDAIRERLHTALRRLPWRPFERFCVYVLKLEGVKECETMRGRKEAGIDLVGSLDLGGAIKSSFWYGAHLRVVGQVKTTGVGQEVVRLFEGDLSTFARGQGAFELAPEWFKRVSGPMFGILLTSKEFTRGAKRWANARHITMRDGQQLAEVLIQHRTAPGLSVEASGQVRFSENDFLNYFRKMPTKA